MNRNDICWNLRRVFRIDESKAQQTLGADQAKAYNAANFIFKRMN